MPLRSRRGSSFVQASSRTKDESTFAAYDLVTAVMHELGHVLGFADQDDKDELMGNMLQPGVSCLLAVDEAMAGGDWLP